MIITLEDLKMHLRIEGNDEDNYLNNLIKVSESICIDFMKRSLVSPPPEPVKLALLMLAGYFYTYREAVYDETYDTTMKAVHRLLWPYRDESKLF